MRYHAAVVAWTLCGLAAACVGPPSSGQDYQVVPRQKQPGSSASGGGAQGVGGNDVDKNDELPSKDGADASTDAPTEASAKPPEASLKIDGALFKVESTAVYFDASIGYNLYINVTGPGAPQGANIDIWAKQTGSICTVTTNFIAYRAEGSDTRYLPRTVQENQGCGLVIDALPAAVGERFRGSFKGTLAGSDTNGVVSMKTLALTFDVVRKE